MKFQKEELRVKAQHIRGILCPTQNAFLWLLVFSLMCLRLPA